MILVNADAAGGTKNWFAVPPGKYQVVAYVASGTPTITLQFAKSATVGSTSGTSLGNLKKSDGTTDISLTATQPPNQGFIIDIPNGYVRATTASATGAITVWLEPIVAHNSNML